MSPTALRMGALGCSSIARRRTLPALRAVENAELTAVAARSWERAEQFAAEFDAVPLSYDDLLGRSDVDAVYVSLPNGLHHKWVGKALRAGKHVLCEKPLTVSGPTTEGLTELAAGRGLVLRENFAFLHHPQHARVRALVDAGRLGELRAFTARFGTPPLPDSDIRYDHALGGGALLDAGVYPVRAAQLLLGPGLTIAGATLHVDERRGVDVTGAALLVSARGVVAHLDFGFRHSYRSCYSLWGSSAAVSLDRAFAPPADLRPVLRVDGHGHTDETSLAPADQFALSITSFADAASTGPDPAVEAYWLAAAVETARLVDGIRARAVHVRVA